jgi:hypothetical protein
VQACWAKIAVFSQTPIYFDRSGGTGFHLMKRRGSTV